MMCQHLKSFFFICASLVLVAFSSRAQGTANEAHIKVALRMVGHQVLLSSGDSVSRVLPIEQEGDHYKIQFESDFYFNPSVLSVTIDSAMALSNIATAYLVEVQECDSGKIAYSYEVGNAVESGIIPCGTRPQPAGCYNLLITLLEPTAAITAFDPAAVNQLGGTAAKTDVAALSAIGIVLLVLLLALVLATYYWKKNQPESLNPDVIQLGKYQFDTRNMTLAVDDTGIELTGKETALLLLLHGAANTTLEREVILRDVWGDEGDYVGRTLDVFISKLRKKLDADPNVRIANIRGVGYKLVVNES